MIYNREIGTIQEQVDERAATDIDDSPGSPSAGARVVGNGRFRKKENKV